MVAQVDIDEVLRFMSGGIAVSLTVTGYLLERMFKEIPVFHNCYLCARAIRRETKAHVEPPLSVLCLWMILTTRIISQTDGYWMEGWIFINGYNYPPI